MADSNGVLYSTSGYLTISADGSIMRIPAYEHITQPVKDREAPCHEKMKGKDRPWAEEAKPRWEKAKALGLMGEMERMEKEILKQDIMELTAGAGYPEVEDWMLEQMFEFPRLRRKVRWHNFKACLPFSNLESITLRLKRDSVERAGVEIPYGAMLRYEEAKETGFFTKFEVVYPNVITESELAKERQREMDPAIVGHFHDAMFLICSWDLPKDIAKAEAKMDDLLVLKLKP